MTSTPTASERTVALPERPGGQGLDSNQEESGNRAIHALLTHNLVGGQTHFVATYRDGAYEVWAADGMVRFERTIGEGGYEYHVVETIGQNPIENQDALAVASVEEELDAARRSGHPTDEPNQTFIEPEHLSYPLAYERVSQLFDSPNAPDLVINPKSYAFGRQLGQHGSLDVVQSRAPLCFAGPNVRPGSSPTAARHIDIAPTIAKLMGFPQVSGRDMCGRPSNDVYFKRQDGAPIDSIIDESAAKPERTYIFLLDGFANDELQWRLDNEPDALPNLRSLIERSHRFQYGSIVNFPSITWPSHNAIGTSCWCGHHDIVNPTYYLRETRQVVTPQGQQFDSAKFLSDDVETLYEAFHRVYGSWEGEDGALTAAIHEPCTRGADHSVLERKVIGDRETLRDLTLECASDRSPRWDADEMKAMQNESTVDARGVAQVLALFAMENKPRFVFHEFTLTDGTAHDYGPHSAGHRDAVDETDKRIGRVISMLKERGLYDSTLFVITADHGMAAIDTELAANQLDLLPQEGMKGIVAPPLFYLLDMAVEIEHARDGRTATITVLANDADETGEQPPVAGAEVTVSGPGGKVLSRVTTDGGGVAGVPLPVEVPAHDIVVTVHHDAYNPRHLRLDGANIAIDLRELLYGRSAT
jgi:hypothetical protein